MSTLQCSDELRKYLMKHHLPDVLEVNKVLFVLLVYQSIYIYIYIYIYSCNYQFQPTNLRFTSAAITMPATAIIRWVLIDTDNPRPMFNTDIT